MEKRKLITIEHPDQDNDRLKLLKVHLVAFLDKRRSTKPADSEEPLIYPIKLRITHERRPYYYVTPVKATNEDYLRITSNNPRGEWREKRQIIWDLLQKANDIILELGYFETGKFKDKLKGEKNDWSNIWAVFDYQINELERRGRFNYATTYRTAKKSFQSFIIDKKRKVRTFDDITVKWLGSYEDWANEMIILKNGTKKIRLSRSSIGVNTRNLKVLFNLSIKNGGTTKNPFIEYSPPSAENSNRALTQEELVAIGKYPGETDFQRYCRDLFLFSYLASGINFADLFRLRYSNILKFPTPEGELKEYLVYERKKTSTKRKATQKITPYNPAMKRIVEEWGTRKQSSDTYLFKLLNKTRDESERVKKIGSMTKTVNTNLKKIADILGIAPNISTYYARHTWASGAIHSGQSVHFVQQQLGHSDTKVTERYIASLGPGILDKAMEFMPDFD